jgi:hypothetical protein
MMDKSLSQSLCGLIPTLPLPLPAALLDLSTSLLAQSRIQARSLKAEEEIARSYACAHLACERYDYPMAIHHHQLTQVKSNKIKDSKSPSPSLKSSHDHHVPRGFIKNSTATSAARY